MYPPRLVRQSLREHHVWRRLDARLRAGCALRARWASRAGRQAAGASSFQESNLSPSPGEEAGLAVGIRGQGRTRRVAVRVGSAAPAPVSALAFVSV